MVLRRNDGNLLNGVKMVLSRTPNKQPQKKTSRSARAFPLSAAPRDAMHIGVYFLPALIICFEKRTVLVIANVVRPRGQTDIGSRVIKGDCSSRFCVASWEFGRKCSHICWPQSE
jgi:hypothetical protein